MDREFLFRIGWSPAGPLGGWVEFVLDSKAEPLGCYVAMHCRYCTETKTLGKHLNSSAGIFSAWRPLTVHVWEIALQWRPQAVSYTMFYWLCMLCQDCSPFRPGTVFMSTQWRTWLVADHDWSPTLPYLTVLATATDPQGGRHNSNLATNNYILPAHEYTVRYTASSFRLGLNTWTRNLWEDSEGLRRNCVQLMHSFFVCQQQQLRTRVSPYLEEKKADWRCKTAVLITNVGSKAAHCLSPTGATAVQLTQSAPIDISEMEQAALNRMAKSIAQLTLCQVAGEEIETATKLLEKACQKLRGIPEVSAPADHWPWQCNAATTST